MKNFVVIGKTVKFGSSGVINMYDYLNNTEHKNHKGKTERIHTIFHNKNFVENVVLEVEKKNLENQINKKGGRPIKEFAQSFCFTLPKGVELTDEQWNIVGQNVFKDIARYLNIDYKELLKVSEINVHIQNNQHLNILCGKVVNGKSIHLSNPRLMNIMKQSFTNEVLKLKDGLIRELRKTRETTEIKTPLNVYQVKKINEEYDHLNDEKTLFEKQTEEIWEQINKVKEENNRKEIKAKKYIVNIGKNLIKYMEVKTTEEQRQQIKIWLSQQVGKLYNQKSKKELTKTIQTYISDFSLEM